MINFIVYVLRQTNTQANKQTMTDGRFYVFLPEVNEENKRLKHRVRLLDLY